MFQFIDFEVGEFDWLCVIINPETEEVTRIHNDGDLLTSFYEKHKDDIWVGHNIKGYDQYIMKGIMLGLNPKEINDFIIVEHNAGWKFTRSFNKIKMIIFDTLMDKGLKVLEGFMGNNIKETSVSFSLKRKWTRKETEEMFIYCEADVNNTIEVFMHQKDEFISKLQLINTFDLPITDLAKTQAQIAAIILEAKPLIDFDDEWDIRVPETIQIKKYNYVVDWFLDKKNHKYLDYHKNKKATPHQLETTISGVKHVLAWGGVHGALEKYHVKCNDDELLIMADVDQLYPTIMIVYKLLSRAVKTYDKFKNILSTSLKLKAEKKKKEREPYKRICNITYGSEGDQNNRMYDPLHRTLVCIYGQLFLLDLIEKVECFAKVIQSNTDGVLLLIKEDDFELLDDTVYEWEKRTGLHMSFDIYNEIYQKDVNNYVLIGDDDIKTKGSYVKKKSPLDNDLPIISKALCDYMINGIPIEKTILECKEMMMFQQIVKLSDKYQKTYKDCTFRYEKIETDKGKKTVRLWNNDGYEVDGKVYRVFAASDKNEGGLFKLKENKNPEKYAGTSDHCFIENGDVRNMKVDYRLDKQFYIDKCYKMLSDYGVNV